MHTKQTIYTFWEPKKKMTPYLQLCLESWKPFIQEFNLILLDYSNLFTVIPDNSIDLKKLKTVELMHQKDIIQAAVLKYNGGIFMDVDMILVQDLFPIAKKYDEFEVVTYAQHAGFMIAKAGAKLVEEWHFENTSRLAELPDKTQIKWDYFANDILNKKLKDKTNNAYQISKLRTAFTPELNYFKSTYNPMDKYQKFWFSEKIALEAVSYESQHIIALHNSWTPDWYKKMSKEEILNHPSLLSRLLNKGVNDLLIQKRSSMSNIVIFLIRLRSKLCRVLFNR